MTRLNSISPGKRSKQSVVFIVLFALLAIKAAAQPTINSFSPASAAVGASVTISGTNFNTTMANNHVVIGGVRATVTAASSTSLTVTVPAGIMGTSPIQVMNTATRLYATSRLEFKPAFAPNKPSMIYSDFTPPTTPLANSGLPDEIFAFEVADMDQDGDMDLVMATADPSTGRVFIRKNISTQGSIGFSSVANNGVFTATVAGLSYVGRQLTVADFDADGKKDIVAAGIATGNIGIIRNLSTGTTLSFSSTVMSTGLSTSHVIAADFDDDGKIDIAYSQDASNSTLMVALNTSPGPGTITFDAPVSAAAGFLMPDWLSVADIDGDGKTDIIAIYNGDMFVYRNTSSVGSASFVRTTHAGILSDSKGMVVGDLSGDDKPDIVIANRNVGTAFATLRNTSSVGSVTFSQTNISVYSASVGSQFSQDVPALGDFNGDGRLDIAMGLEENNNVYFGIFNNTSTQSEISFSSPYLLYNSNSHNTTGITQAADFDGDGKTDVIGSIYNTSRLVYLRNRIQFAPTITAISTLSAAPASNISITGTGFNTNAASNLVRFGTVTATVSSITSGGTVLNLTVPFNASYGPITVLNTGNTLSAQSPNNFIPIFTPGKSEIRTTDFIDQGLFTPTDNLYGMAAGDLTGDGKPDLVITNSAGDNLIILPNTSTIGGPVTFGAQESITPTAGTFNNPRHVALGDLDGDGWLDMAIPSYGLSRVVIFLNSGSGVVATAFTVAGSYATGWAPNGIAIGDLDGDGKPELVTSNISGGSISIFRNTSVNTGIVSFAAREDFAMTTPHAIYDVSLADIDNDGKLDIVGGQDINSNPGNLVMLRNASTSGILSFTGLNATGAIRAPWTIATGDLNADGRNDLVVGSGSNVALDQINVFTKLITGGNLANFAQLSPTVNGDSRTMALGDLNGDGKPDIITGNQSATPGYYTQVFPNTTSGSTVSLASRVDLPGSAAPYKTVVTDMNRDGKPDIVVGNQLINGSTIRVYRNALIATPVVQASGITVTGLTGTTATFSWTNGSGAERAVFIKQDNTGNAAPENNTPYTGNPAFGSGSQIDATGWYCVYNGTGNQVTVTGFTPSVRYQIMVTEYNDGGLSNTEQYNTNTATNNPLTVTTRATITALSRTGAASTNASTVDYRLSLGSAILSGPAISNFTVTMGGAVTGATVTSINSGSTVFTVTVNTGSGDGTVRLNFANTTSLDPGLTNVRPYLGEVYTIDKTAPTLSPVTIVSNNSNTARARSGDIITLSFTSSETIATPTVTIAGQAAAVTNTGGDNWTATRTMTGTDADGTIAFNIAFSDLVGNAGTAVSATTNSSSVLFDKTAPTLSPVTIASNNGNTAWAKQGNTVTLAFTADETINTPVVTIAGHTITPSNTGGNNWTASYTMTGGDAEGPVAFTILFSDITGNNGTTVTATTNSSSVTYDISNPGLSTVTIASANSNTTKAKTGDAVTISFSANEGVTPVVTIAGQTVAPVNTSANNWTASYTMTGTDAEGMVPFSISFTDVSGNAGTAVSATTNGSSVVFDRTTPALSVVTIISGNANTSKARSGDVVTLNFTADESIQAPTVQVAGHTATAINTSANAWTASYTMTGTDAEGTVSFSIAFNDLSGNTGTIATATTNSSSVVFDRTAPILSAVAIVSGNANTARARTGDLVTLNFTADENIQTPTVQIAGHTVPVINTSANAWAASYTMTGTDAQGTVSFSIAFNDITGNAGTTVTGTTNNSLVVFDRTIPMLSPVSILSGNSNIAKARTGDRITVNFTASEALLTPTLQIATHSITPINVTGNVWTGYYTMTGSDAEGNITFSISFGDLAGNTGTTVTTSTNNSNVMFDRTVPVLSPVAILSGNGNAGWARTGDRITLSFTASEGVLTPALTIATHTITPVIVSGNAWTASYTMTIADNEGTVPFSILFTDLAGNEGISVTGTTDNSKVVFDRTVPVLQTVSIISDHTLTQTALPGNEVSLSFTVSETVFTPTVHIAGHAVTATGAGNNAWTASYTMTGADAEGQVSFSITAIDMAGNTTAGITASTDNSKVNFIKPVSPYFTNGTVQALVICQDVTADISNLLKVTHTANGQPLTITIISTSSNGTLTGFAKRLVSNGGIVTPAGLTYKPAAGFSGADAFTMMVTDGMITSTTTINVTVNAIPSGSITASNGTVLCEGSVLTLTVNGGSSYKWYREGVLINGATTNQLSATAPGVYTAILASAAGCESPASNSITVTMIQKPKADFTIGTNTCINLSVPFTNASATANSGGVDFLWNDGQGQASTAASVSFTFAQAGTYNVKLKLTPQLCPALADSMIKPVTISQPAAGIRNPSVDVSVSEVKMLQSRVLPNATYQWSPVRFLVTSNTLPNPSISATEQEQYLIRITVPNGCITVDTLLVRIHQTANIYVPNVFTPNGDGQNDILMPNLVGVTQLRFFRIFNRWGKLMFETANIGQGWNGKYNGVLQPLDTYTWSIEGYDKNNILVKRQGSITLLR